MFIIVPSDKSEKNLKNLVIEKFHAISKKNNTIGKLRAEYSTIKQIINTD